MFKKLDEVLTPEKIKSVINNVRQVMKDRYGDDINRAEIAIGNFYNSVALIYIGHSQRNMAEVYGLEPYATAQLAINHNGEFIKFQLDKDHEYFGFETYNSESDSTLVRFDLQRAKNVIDKDTITTDDFRSWKHSKDKYKLANELFCYCKVKKGNISPYTEPIQEYIDYEEECIDDYYDDCIIYADYDDEVNAEIDEDNYKPILSATFYFRCNSVSSVFLNPIKLDTNQNTLYIIKNRYVLLCDNMSHYIPEEYYEYDDPNRYVYSYYYLFARYHIGSTDILENRYGVYDLFVKKTIIHVGEIGDTEAMISGFTRLDFTSCHSILTFDYFDRKTGKGVPYNKKLTYNGINNLAINCIDGRRYNRAANIITDYWYDEKSRTGKNAGEWYIIREGKNAGRTLCWLLANNKIKDVVHMIATSYLSFDNFQHFTYPSSYDKKQRNKIWIALDSQKIFEEIKNSADVLELAEPFNEYSLTKHQSLVRDSYGEEEPYFEQLIKDDTDYIVGLIEHHCLLVDDDVFVELEKTHGSNKSYLKKLSKVKDANDRYKVEIKGYEEWCEDEERSRWEREEQKYLENEGYHSAFENDPDAEWNID